MNSPRTGGILKGKKHTECDHNGCGIKTVAGSVHKEAEGGEFLLSAKPLKSKKVITVTGTKRQIAEKINGAGGIVEGKQTLHVDPGQYVINARAMTDLQTFKVTGTPLQIASAINADKGYGIEFAPGATISRYPYDRYTYQNKNQSTKNIMATRKKSTRKPATQKLKKGGSTGATKPSSDKETAVGALLVAMSKLDSESGVRGGTQKLQRILGKEIYFKSPDGKKWLTDAKALGRMSIKKLESLTAQINAAAPKKLAKGGSTNDEGVDLFEQYDALPENIQALIGEYQSRIDDEDPYELAAEYQKRFEAEGYTFDWGLDGEAINLRKLDGGSVDDDEVDLFEYYDQLPNNVQAILAKYADEDGEYHTLDEMQSELEPLGYTFDYGLDATPYDLRKIDQNKLAKGGSVNDSVKSLFEEAEKQYRRYAGASLSMANSTNSNFIDKRMIEYRSAETNLHNISIQLKAKGFDLDSARIDMKANRFDINDLQKYSTKNQPVNPTALAKEFSRLMRAELTPAQMDEAIALNKTPEYANACATHNYCDSNQVMLDAFENVAGRPFSFTEADHKVEHKAWNIAREHDFYHNDKLAKGGSTGNNAPTSVIPYDEDKHSSVIDYLEAAITDVFGPQNKYSGSADWGGMPVWGINGAMYEGTFIVIDDNQNVILMTRQFDEENEENIDTDIEQVDAPSLSELDSDPKPLQKNLLHLFKTAWSMKKSGKKLAKGGSVSNPDKDIDNSGDRKSIGNKVGQYKNQTLYFKKGKWKFPYYSRSNNIYSGFKVGPITANAKSLQELKAQINKLTPDQLSTGGAIAVIEEGDIVKIKNSKLKGEATNVGDQYITVEFIGARPPGGDKRGVYKPEQLEVIEQLAKGGPVSVDAKTQKQIDALEASIASAATPDNMKAAMRAKVAELKATAKPAKSKPVSKTEILRFINSSKSGVTAEAIEGQFPTLSPAELSTALSDLEKAGKAHVNDAGKITAGPSPKKADKNVLNDLKPKFNKQIDDYGITSAMIVDGELNTLSEYEIPADTAAAMEKHLKGQKGPEKGQKKTVDQTSQAVNNLINQITDIAIDLEGEDETAVAGFRFELEDVDPKDANAVHNLIVDFENDWLNDLPAKQKKEIKKAFADYYQAVDKKSKSSTDKTKKAEPAHSGKTGSDLVKYVDKEIDGIIGKTLYFKAGANGKWIKGKIEAVEPFDKTKEHWNIEFYPVGGAKEFDAPMVSDKLTTKQVDEFIHGAVLKKYTLTKPESEVIKDFDDAIKEIDICHEEAKSKRVSNQRKNPPVKKKPAEILKNKVSSLHGYALKRIEKKNPEKAPALKKILDRHKKELDAFFASKK